MNKLDKIDLIILMLQMNNKIVEVNNKLKEVDAKVQELTNRVNTAITNCNNATNECIEVTNRLKNMFEIGNQVPVSLPTGKVYFQYF